jgi:hypothetical protein
MTRIRAALDAGRFEHFVADFLSGPEAGLAMAANPADPRV